MATGQNDEKPPRAVWDLSAGVVHWRFDDGHLEKLPVRWVDGAASVVIPEQFMVEPGCMRVEIA